MTVPQIILAILLIIVSVIIIAVVLIQKDRSSNASAVMGGGGNSEFFDKTKGHRRDDMLSKLTIGFGAVLVVLIIAALGVTIFA